MDVTQDMCREGERVRGKGNEFKKYRLEILRDATKTSSQFEPQN